MSEGSPGQRTSESQYAIRQLQRRPAPPAAEAATSDLIWALGSRGQTNVVPSGGDYRIRFDSLYSNSTTAFEIADVTSHVGDWLQINEPGYYLFKQVIFKSTLFDNTDLNTFLQPLVELGGSPAGLQDNTGIADYMGLFYGAPNEVLSGNDAHTSLEVSMTFNWNPASPVSDLDFENPLKIGCQLATQNRSSTYMLGMYTLLVRLAAEGYNDLSP